MELVVGVASSVKNRPFAAESYGWRERGGFVA